MLNVISCFVAAFCLCFFFFSTILCSTLVIYSLQAMCAFSSASTYTHHRAVQIDFCLNWSLGVTVERYLDRRRGGRGGGIFMLEHIQELNHSVYSKEVEF